MNEWWAGENPIVLCGVVCVLIRWSRFAGPGFCCLWNNENYKGSYVNLIDLGVRS